MRLPTLPTPTRLPTRTRSPSSATVRPQGELSASLDRGAAFGRRPDSSSWWIRRDQPSGAVAGGGGFGGPDIGAGIGTGGRPSVGWRAKSLARKLVGGVGIDPPGAGFPVESGFAGVAGGSHQQPSDLLWLQLRVLRFDVATAPAPTGCDQNEPIDSCKTRPSFQDQYVPAHGNYVDHDFCIALYGDRYGQHESSRRN